MVIQESKIIEKDGQLYKVKLEVSQYEDGLSSNELKKIISAVKKASETAYSYIKNNTNKSSWYNEFLQTNSSAPKYGSLDTKFCDIPMIMLKFAKNTFNDYVLFYQDMVAKVLNKDSSVSEYKFWTEDYPGIFVKKK